nr:immunoglobulin heavy chain junction region [Mus musculus]
CASDGYYGDPYWYFDVW